MLVNQSNVNFAGRLIVANPARIDDSTRLTAEERALLQQHKAQAEEALAPYQKLVELLTPEKFELCYRFGITNDKQTFYQFLSPSVQVGSMNLSGGNSGKSTPLAEVQQDPARAFTDFHHWITGQILFGFNSYQEVIKGMQRRLASLMQTVDVAQSNLQHALFNVFPDPEKAQGFTDSFESGHDEHLTASVQKAYAGLDRMNR